MRNERAFKLNRIDIIPLTIWSGILFITWTFMHEADRFLALTPEALGKYYDFKWFLIAHITCGGGAILLGLMQFWQKLRAYSWKLHRFIGVLYLLSILVSSFSAVILALTTAYEISFAYAFSLQVWVAVWMSSTAIAYYAAIRKNFALHETWMMRSYIVTIAFVISGLIYKIPYVQNLGSFDEVAPSLFWMGWSVPLYTYELIRSRNKFRERPIKKNAK